MKILVLNAGSSSQKCTLYELGDILPQDAPAPLWEAYADWSQGAQTAHLSVHTARGAMLDQEHPAGSREQLLQVMLETLWSGPTQVIAQPSAIDIVGHRVVHGGRDYLKSVRITPDVKATIARLATFAPQHNPINLEGIEAIEKLLPHVPQVAAFDTSFHAHLPLPAAVYPGPYEWFERGIRRYGFHGLSHQYCAERAPQLLGRDPHSLRLITCHLGNGCSLAAIRAGRSIDTTMGFTPLDGLMMGSRSGALDPGILTYLLRQPGASVDQLDDTLNHNSGLKGISGVSNDMRDILAARQQGNNRASLAFDMYVHRLCAYIGAMLASLGGTDALVFTGGVGEHVAPVRAAACEPFAYLGLTLDADRNTQSPTESPPDRDIASRASSIRVLVIRTEEDWMIARDCWRLARSA